MEYFWVWLICYLVSCVVWGFITKHVAESKGYEHGFAWGFWLGILGLFIVGFKPNIQQPMQSEYHPMYPKTKPQWTCICGEKNPDTMSYCWSCRRNRGESKPVAKIRCPHCGANNNKENELCFACNNPLHGKKVETNAAVVAGKKVETNAAVVAASGAADEILKFKQLLDAGVITQEEFDAMKKQLLGL